MRATITTSRSKRVRRPGELQKRTLVLDNLIHGYFILGHPERLDYDYEHIYALVAYRAAKAERQGEFKPAPSQREPRRAARPRPAGPETSAPRTSHPSSRRPAQPQEPTQDVDPRTRPPPKHQPTGRHAKPSRRAQERAGRGRTSVKRNRPTKDKAAEAKDSIPEEPLPSRETGGNQADRRAAAPSIPAVEKSSMKTLFLGGGAYCFQRHMQYAYPGTGGRRRRDRPRRDRRQFHGHRPAQRHTRSRPTGATPASSSSCNQDTKQYDLVFGDAFNDFSVPWHLTTREFNEKIKKMLTPNGVYMINIIDVYESDAHAEKKAEEQDRRGRGHRPAKNRPRFARVPWPRPTATAGSSGPGPRPPSSRFPTSTSSGPTTYPGSGLRETFVVVVSMQPLDLKDLGSRADDPKFYTKEIANRTQALRA